MDILNVGPAELILVLIIAILVAGPKRMVEIAHSLGRISRQLRDLSREFTTALQAEVKAAETEAGKVGEDLDQVRGDLESALSGTSSAPETPQRERAGSEAPQDAGPESPSLEPDVEDE